MNGVLFLIPALPFLAFVFIVLFTHQNRRVSAGLTIGATAIAGPMVAGSSSRPSI